MRVLLTGHDGYIGSVMAPALVEARPRGGRPGHRLLRRLHARARRRAEMPAVRKDIRDLEPPTSRASTPSFTWPRSRNDPIGNLNDGWTEEINYQASVRLAELAKAAGVERFLFSSSCIMYGMSEAAVVDETSPLDPKTEYARSKVKAERAIVRAGRATASRPTFLRNGTVYGLSPRMRFDTVFNDLMGRAVTTRKVVVYGDGKPWRPVVHVKDLVRAFVAALEAPREQVHNQAFNNGADHLNHQVGELARIAVEAVPGCTLEVLGEPGADQRTYKADFSQVGPHVPGLRVRVDPGAGRARAARRLRGDRPDARGLRRQALHPAEVAAPPARQRRGGLASCAGAGVEAAR